VATCAKLLRDFLNTEGKDADNAAKILEDDEDKGWLKLEDGIQIKFKKNANSIYRTGDYWLIPANAFTIFVVSRAVKE
jgi:Family of unknown function (DUF6519)